jgi:hypothetical protein
MSDLERDWKPGAHLVIDESSSVLSGRRQEVRAHASTEESGVRAGQSDQVAVGVELRKTRVLDDGPVVHLLMRPVAHLREGAVCSV